MKINLVNNHQLSQEEEADRREDDFWVYDDLTLSCSETSICSETGGELHPSSISRDLRWRIT